MKYLQEFFFYTVRIMRFTKLGTVLHIEIRISILNDSKVLQSLTQTVILNGISNKIGLSLKPWGIALKFLFLHHENILFPND